MSTPTIESRMSFPTHFPSPPPGVTIIPFKSFLEKGIRIDPNDGEDIERDGWGIPTIPIRLGKKPRENDRCKTETRRKREQIAPVKKKVPSGAKREWYDEWDETEHRRLGGPYDPLSSSLDRLEEAALHFKKQRHWPPGPQNRGLSSLWDEFCRFAGLNRDKEKKPEAEAEAEANDGSDDDEDGFEEEPMEPITLRPDEDDTMFEFLNDPEEKTKIFLSSYMRKRGLIWDERNLISLPKLLIFFINYILRSRVFPPTTEPQIEKGFKKALEVATLAEKELIFISKTSKALPDLFGRSMKECWGQKADGYVLEAVEPFEEPGGASRGGEDGEVDGDGDGDTEQGDEDIPVRVDAASSAANVIEGLDKALEDVDIKPLNISSLSQSSQSTTTSTSSSTDASSTGWGTSSNDLSTGWASASWGDPSAGLNPSDEFLNSSSTSGSGSGSLPTVGDEAQEGEEAALWPTETAHWELPEPESLFSLLGPSALPITHTTGVVEWSLRRVKSFTPPPSSPQPKSAVSAEPSPAAVDGELERRFGKLVMEPWIGWDKANDSGLPHLADPRILVTSRGPIFNANSEEPAQPTTDTAPTTVAADGPKPHDPHKDEITVLIDPNAVPSFCEGLGIGATWVQLAWEQDLATSEGGKKKKKGKKNTRFWYAEEVLMVVPSFHS